MEVAAVGTFLSVGIKLPYFAFFGSPDKKQPLKPIPINMYIAMAISSVLCFIIGVQPHLLYKLLPYEVEYVPYTTWHVLQSLLLLSFTGLGFYLLRHKLRPEAKLNLDFDYLYRAVGKLVLIIAKWPIEVIDNFWSEFYAHAGLAGLLVAGKISSWFDKFGIDTVVDGTAVSVRHIGRAATMVQTGRLQDYLSLAVIIGMIIFAVIWFIAM
jgi:multicomponent Na+:H+ antiporter subunit D